ncbi:MAG TPA: protein kinase [Polyangiaceae bacterium]|nr:protein kinase [Polyangiaceae bacterium]
MSKLDEWTEADEATDTTFDHVLRRAAHVSSPVPVASGRRLQPGNALLGGRLQIVRRIGEGGMGVVYEARDNQRRTGSVALKTLSRLEPNEVYRLKNEFRSLAELRHPGICQLFELFCEDEQWFFSMEFVAGVPFDQWVRPSAVLNEARARDAFARLFSAIAAVHQRGKLHRDLKPSNVLVREDGRVVVLDFGLASDPEPGGVGQTLTRERFSGTPSYMAPEQAAGAVATAASDQYSAGVMLFEALTGMLPFRGPLGEVLARKQYESAPRVHTFAPDAPGDLASLCDALLERDSARRPSAETALRGLIADTLPALPVHEAQPSEQEGLLGRDEELRALRAAYAGTLDGQLVTVFVAGGSGIGKSALISTFLDTIQAESDAIVLRGRCYENESVPFKAFDAIVDQLTRHLRKLTPEVAGQVMPREVFALTRLFPVLDRVEAVQQAPRRDWSDPHELQRRAFSAFGELLARIRDRRPLVIHIDDLQWTCRDSTLCLAALLSLPEPPPLLLIASYRSEHAEHNPLLQETLRAALANRLIRTETLRLAELSSDAAIALARRTFPDAPADALAAIAHEAGGSPFFVGELSRQARSTGSLSPTLQDTVLRRVERMTAIERRLLEILAVAGRPLPIRVALDAARAESDVQDALLSERLARMTGTGYERLLECYHDRIRESVVAALETQALREVHRCLAETLVHQAGTDPEHLALHFHGVGEHSRASQYYEHAGDASLRALAFDYAARQYQQALDLGYEDERRSAALLLKLGAALASAGRSREAAGAYQRAASSAPSIEALEHTRTAAHLLMTSGYVDEGRELLGKVLESIGLSLPRSRRHAIAGALWSRARLSLRGTRVRHDAHADSSVKARLAALWTVIQGSVGNDPFLMVEMAARYARLALDHGLCDHGARALGMEAYLVSFDGAGTHAANIEFVARAAELAARSRDPAVIGWVKLVHGAALVHEGRFTESKRVLVDALGFLTERCSEVPFELAGVRVYRQNASFHLGEHAELARAAPHLVEDALHRGDMYQAILLATGFAIPASLVHGGTQLARPHLEGARRRIQRQRNYQWSDHLLLLAELSTGLYESRYDEPLALVDAQWPALEQSQLMRMQICSALTHFACGGVALAKLRTERRAHSADRARLASHVKGLRRTRLSYAPGLAAILESGLALHEHRDAHAAEKLRSAVAYLEASDLRMYAACARLRLGQLLGGEEGREWTAAAQSTFDTESVFDPEASADMLAPGCRSRS